MKRLYVLLFAMVIAFHAGPLFAHEGEKHNVAAEQAVSGETTEAKKYVCPMHPDVQSDEPGECPKCGMTLKQTAQGEGV